MLKIRGIYSAKRAGPLGFLLTLFVSCQHTCDANSERLASRSASRPESSIDDGVLSTNGKTIPPGSKNSGDAEVIASNAKSGCRSWSDLDLQKLPSLTPSRYTAAFEHLWKIVLRKHYDPTLNCLDWPRLRLEYGAKLESTKDRLHAYQIYNQMLAQLGQSHLRAVPLPGTPSGSNTEELEPRDTESGPARAPINMRWIDGRWIVVRSKYGDADPIPPGAVLVTIAEKDPIKVQEDIASAFSKPGRMVAPESSRSLSFEQKAKVEGLLHCPEGGTKKIGFLDPHVNDALRHRTLDCVLPAGERASLGNLRNLPTRISWKMIKGTSVGYLAFNYWMLSMVPKIEQAIAELESQGMQALLIDLRGNPGGIAPMVIPVARLLLEQGGDLGQLTMRDFSQEFKVAPGVQPFVGPVDILIDESSASTSEIFSLGMRDLGRVSLVGGSASAGMALPSLIEKLPDGGLIQYVVGTYKSSKGNVAEGGGVKPDILVDENRRDFIAGRDSVLEAAIEHVQRVQR